MVKQVAGWEADDGTLFKVEQQAKDHDFVRYLDAWFVVTFQLEDGARAPTVEKDERPYLDTATAKVIKDAMFADRFNLLGIFKGLNGGSGIPPGAVHRAMETLSGPTKAPYIPPNCAPVPPLDQTPISTGEKLDQGSRANQLFQR